jgi:spermidine/putrescine-binding protein
MTAFQTFTAGQILTAAQQTALQANSTKISIFEQQQASSSDGGTATINAWTKRTLNTTVVNTSTSQLRLRNTTAGADLALGATAFAASGVAAGTFYADLKGYFTLTGSTNIELQYYVLATNAGNDLGVGGTWGTNVFANVTLVQVA